MLTRNGIKALLAEHDFAPLKRLGANYLIDGNIKDKIIASVELSEGDTVLEIGPGLGALTVDLAESEAHVIAVEKDKKASLILEDMVGGKFPNLKIINGDILDFDIEGIASRKIKVVGNLPYYITTPIIEYLIKNKRLISMAVIMVQDEVARRLAAKAGDEDYGSLSCFVQYHAGVERIYKVKRTCFYPEPDVDSAILRLNMLETPSVKVKDEELLFRIIRGAFNQRRKSIINSLSREAVLDMPKEKLSAALEHLGIDPSIRPEQLSLSDFARLTNVIR